MVEGDLVAHGGALTRGDARAWAFARAGHAGVLLHAIALPVTLAGVQIGILVALGALALARLSGIRLARSGLEAPLLLAAAGMLAASAIAWTLGSPPVGLDSSTRWKPVLAPMIVAAALALPAPGEGPDAPRLRALAAVLAWCAGGAVASVVGVVQAALGVDLVYVSGHRAEPLLASVPQWPGHFAAVGFYPWYPQFAHNLASPLALAAALALSPAVSRRSRAALGVAAALAATAVALTVSRAAWLSLVAELLVLFALGGRGPRRALAATAAALAAASILHPGLRVRLEVAWTASVNVHRLELLRVCEAVWREHPLGVGPGNFTREAGPIYDALAPDAVRTGCHMTPLGLLVEGGPLLAAAWALALVLVALALLQWHRAGDALARAGASGGLAALAAFAVNGLFHDVHRESHALWALGFALGIAAALAAPRAGAGDGVARAGSAGRLNRRRDRWRVGDMLRLVLWFAVLGAVLVGGRMLLRRPAPGRERKGLRESGAVVLRPPRLLNLALGATVLPVPVFVAILEARLAGRSEVGRLGLVLVGFLVALGIGGALWLVAAEFRQRFVVTEFSIERFGVATRRRLAWSSVARIDFNPLRRWFFLTGADGSHLWIGADLRGVGDFAAIALVRLPPRVLDLAPEAREELEELAAEAEAG